MKIKNFFTGLACVLFSQLAGIIGAFFTVDAIQSWYAFVEKPWFSPPNWLFGPVWILLYTFIGIALYLVWKSDHPKRRLALKVFAVQWVLNLLWTPLFFGLQQPLIAFIEIMFLWISILFMIKIFAQISKWTPYLLVPYLLWVTFASMLNFSIYWLN